VKLAEKKTGRMRVKKANGLVLKWQSLNMLRVIIQEEGIE